MFWGLTLEPGRHYVKTVDWSFHVSMAAMDSKAALAAGVTQVKVQRGFSDFVLCTLVHGSLYQQSLDLVFGDGERVIFSADGKATIHLTGYFVPRNQLLPESRSSPIISQENEDDMHFLSRCEEPFTNAGRQDVDNSLQERGQEIGQGRVQERGQERRDCIVAEIGTDIEAHEEDASESLVTVTVKEEPEEDSQSQNYVTSEVPVGSKVQDAESRKEYANDGASAGKMIELQSFHTPKQKQRKIMLSPRELQGQPRKTVMEVGGEADQTQGTSSRREIILSRKELYQANSNFGWIDLNSSSSFNKNQDDGQQGMDDQIEIIDETGDNEIVPIVEDPSPRSMNSPGYTHFKIKSQRMEHLSTKCSVCWNIFKTRTAFANHKCRVKHLRCRFCGKKYASKKGLMGHENNHMGLKPYPCRHCDECFTSSVFRTSHERKFHTGKSVFCCKYCAKVCIGAESLQKHENIHKGVRPFRCEVCESTFLIERDLKKHMEKKHQSEHWETENG